MGFTAAIQSFISHWLSFRGRACRAEYWYVGLANGVITTLNTWTSGHPGVAQTTTYEWIIMVPLLALTVRRLHDTGRSAWWLLLHLPLYAGMVGMAVLNPSKTAMAPGLVLLLVLGSFCALWNLWLMVLPGEAGSNVYGSNPLAPEPEQPAVNVVALRPTEPVRVVWYKDAA